MSLCGTSVSKLIPCGLSSHADSECPYLQKAEFSASSQVVPKNMSFSAACITCRVVMPKQTEFTAPAAWTVDLVGSALTPALHSLSVSGCYWLLSIKEEHF